MKTRDPYTLFALLGACVIIAFVGPAKAATMSASGGSPVESVTITLPAGLLANSKLFVRVVAASNGHISGN